MNAHLLPKLVYLILLGFLCNTTSCFAVKNDKLSPKKEMLNGHKENLKPSFFKKLADKYFTKKESSTTNDQKKIGFGVAALIAGILSFTVFIVPLVGIFFIPLAIIFGLIQLLLIKKNRKKYGGKKLSIWGMALAGLVTIIATIVIIIIAPHV